MEQNEALKASIDMIAKLLSSRRLSLEEVPFAVREQSEYLYIYANKPFAHDKEKYLKNLEILKKDLEYVDEEQYESFKRLYDVMKGNAVKVVPKGTEKDNEICP